MNKNPKSECCKAPMEVLSADEGACYFKCTACGKACDIYSGDKHPTIVKPPPKPISSPPFELLHEPYCHFFKEGGPKSCSCRLMELYLKGSAIDAQMARKDDQIILQKEIIKKFHDFFLDDVPLQYQINLLGILRKAEDMIKEWEK